MPETASAVTERTVQIETARVMLDGDLSVPSQARAVVLFAHGSGSSRLSGRNQRVARYLRDSGFGTLLMDLLTRDEEEIDDYTREYRFDIDRLAERLVGAAAWLSREVATSKLPIAMFGASTGGGAALVAAAEVPQLVKAVVSRGGRPDLAGAALSRVQAPTLLIVGGNDEPVIELNREALARLRAPARLEIVPGATHLFEEPGALEEVSRVARDWLV
jgi:dienelactone hydrolase